MKHPDDPARCDAPSATGSGALADVIAEAGAREAWNRLVACVEALGDDVRVRRGPMDVCAEVAGRPLCRLVPYARLVHVLVGESPAWETRVRRAVDVPEAADRIVTTYLRAIAEGADAPAPAPPATDPARRPGAGR